MNTQLKPYVLNADEGVPGFDSSVKASRRSTNGGLTLIESKTDGGAPRHIHANDDEYFYVVEGSIIVHCGDETFHAGPRSFVFLPRGIPHDWDVTSGTAIVLMITVPAGLEEFLSEYHAAHGSPKAVQDEIAARYGITWVRD